MMLRSILHLWRMGTSEVRYTESPEIHPSRIGAPMTATLLYRISAFVLVLFAAGHTLGFMKFKAPTPEGVAAQQAMDNVRFSIGGKSLACGDFYRGFGLFCTAYHLFGAFLSW